MKGLTWRRFGTCQSSLSVKITHLLEATPMTYSCGSKPLLERSVAYGIPGVRVNGKDLVEVYEAAGEAIARARRGEGPTLIECVTYRNYGHFEGDEQKYKAKRRR